MYNLFDSLFDILINVVNFITDKFMALCDIAVTKALSFLPAEIAEIDWAQLGTLYHALNDWLPLSEFMVCMNAYFAFNIGIALARIFMRVF